MDRKAFIARIRRALGRDGQPSAEPLPTAPVADEAMVRLMGADEDLAALFAERAAAVGMEVVSTQQAALGQTIAAILTEASVRSVVSALDEPAVEQALQQAGIELSAWRGDRTMAACYGAGAGLTGVEAAVAETGTLVLSSSASMGRGLPLAPPLHMAVVRRSQIVADLLDGLAAWSEPPAWVGLITGPSKTADIEGILVTGVHGPRRVVVVVVEDA